MNMFFSLLIAVGLIMIYLEWYAARYSDSVPGSLAFLGNKGLAAVAIGIVGLVCLWLSPGHAQEQHTHEGRVGKFYSTWTMPDAPQTSCCHDQDCSPAASKFENGKWYAQRDGTWYPVPEHKIERERDSPDGRSHVCGRIGYSGQFTVFCFVRGNGA